MKRKKFLALTLAAAMSLVFALAVAARVPAVAVMITPCQQHWRKTSSEGTHCDQNWDF